MSEHQSWETSRPWKALGVSASDLNGPGIKPQTSRTDTNALTTKLNGVNSNLPAGASGNIEYSVLMLGGPEKNALAALKFGSWVGSLRARLRLFAVKERGLPLLRDFNGGLVHPSSIKAVNLSHFLWLTVVKIQRLNFNDFGSMTEWLGASFLWRPWLRGWWFSSYNSLSVASLYKMLHDKDQCLVESDQIAQVTFDGTGRQTG